MNMLNKAHEPLPLADFQRWMVSVVTHFGTDDQAWNSDVATAELSHDRAFKNVLPSKTLTEYDRIGIYRRMYFLRMRDSLAVDFPSVLHLLGKPQFEELTEQYFTAHPSNSYTLNDTGLKFPSFMRSTTLPDKEFIAQLAELELAISAVMEAPEVPPISAVDIAGIPPDAWDTAIFTAVEAFSLHEFAYPVHDYFCAVEDKHNEFPNIQPHPNFVYIHRSKFHTQHYALRAEEYRLLELLIQGTTLGEAFEAVQQVFTNEQTNLEELQARISSRFQEWIMNGVFAAIRT